MARTLPPMPGTDERFWDHAEVIKIDEKPFTKCEHEFKSTHEGAQCKKCHFGLIGIFDVREGKLFHKNAPIDL